jgi:hypothetical protein
VLVVLVFVSFFVCACSRERPRDPVVVLVFRNPAATEADLALRAVSEKRLSASHSEPIVIATLESKSYSDSLATLGNQVHPDLVILDSFEDVQKAKLDVSSESGLRVSTKQYFLIIPPWASKEQRAAAELVSVDLRHELLMDRGKTSTQ